MAAQPRDRVRARAACGPAAAETIREAQRGAHLLRWWTGDPCRLDLHVRLQVGLPGLALLAHQRLHRLRRADELRQRLDRTRAGLVRPVVELREGFGVRQSSGDWHGRLPELSGRLPGPDSAGPSAVTARQQDSWRRDLLLCGNLRLRQL